MTDLYDQEHDFPIPEDALRLNGHTIVSRGWRGAPGWGYCCMAPDCYLNPGRRNFHALAGYTTRALAVDAATQHVQAVRERREVLA